MSRIIAAHRLTIKHLDDLKDHLEQLKQTNVYVLGSRLMGDEIELWGYFLLPTGFSPRVDRGVIATIGHGVRSFGRHFYVREVAHQEYPKAIPLPNIPKLFEPYLAPRI